MKLITLAALLIGVPCSIITYAMMVASAPRTKEEQDYVDQEQTEYLEKWNAEHPKKKRGKTSC